MYYNSLSFSPCRTIYVSILLLAKIQILSLLIKTTNNTLAHLSLNLQQHPQPSQPHFLPHLNNSLLTVSRNQKEHGSSLPLKMLNLIFILEKDSNGTSSLFLPLLMLKDTLQGLENGFTNIVSIL